ncbi:phosphatidylcholine synthase [Legionella spiritensis]|uniref:phosphatidylcholine synthase n=1 Tax=Legionella spiritensis TaxID=452 RepID=UPI000F712FCD|nr:CDP-alcohol phosphatidyltransferase family protein [Legionella spiritensis]VEG89971.1 lidK (CDP-alcohol) phosphatidyltransferase [Legionella spiritensis]
MTNRMPGYHPFHYLVAWGVHAFTASAACFGLLTLIKIYQNDYVQALWFMAIAVVIDAIDGTLARLVKVKSVLPGIDGSLLDNIVDYLNYVITPCFFLFVKPNMLPAGFILPIIIAITITSSYQFCQSDAKTPDHFFKGFPCYWNITVFYMFILNTTMYTNAIILSVLCLLIFVPIKYVYPSRLDYLTESRALKVMMHIFSLIYGISSGLILWNYPNTDRIYLTLSIGYVVMYLCLSIYRTFSPLLILRTSANKH